MHETRTMKIALSALLLFSTLTLSAQLRHPAAQVLLAGAGSVTGANGQFFRSDIVVVNYRDVAQQVMFEWMPQGSANFALTTITINANSGIISEDFVATYLHQSGLGSLLISGIHPDNTVDVDAKLVATERIWSNQPGLSSGTVSQTFPAIALTDISLTRATILGQRIDSRFRTNVGVMNLDLAQHDFIIVQTTDDPATPTITTVVTVPAMSMQQVPLQAAASTALQIAVQPTEQIGTAVWMAYGSSVDNVTGDSWSSLGFQAR